MKEHEKQEKEKMEKLLKTLESHPLAKQIRDEEEAAVLATRKEAAAAIKAIEAERDGTIPKLQADLDAKELKFKKAKTAMEAAGGEFNRARGALSMESQSFDSSISTQEQILTNSADPQIDEGINFFMEKLEWLRSPGRISHNMTGGEKNIYTETVTFTQETNIPAINEALGYCRAAIKELERMKLEPALDLQKIEAMKKAIPSIDIYSEATGEKPIENSKGRSFASYFKSADQHDFEVGKLLEKASKLLSPAPKRARA